MKAVDYVKTILEAENRGDATTTVIVQLMKEVNVLLEKRHALNSQGKCRIETAARCVKELNTKWLAIHRHAKLHPALKSFFIEACKREWPKLEGLV